MSAEKLVTLTESTLGKVQMQCGHSPTYRRGYDAKIEWTRARIREGLRYTVMQVNGHTAGMMETIPGEYAWRGVEAQGYLFIHCFWVIGQNRGHGYGKKLLSACLEDARGTNGVAVMVSKAHWLPTPKIFLKNGFTLADHACPVFRFAGQATQPAGAPAALQAACIHDPARLDPVSQRPMSLLSKCGRYRNSCRGDDQGTGEYHSY